MPNSKSLTQNAFWPIKKTINAILPGVTAVPNKIRGIIPFLSDLKEYRELAETRNQLLPEWEDIYPQLDDRFQESGVLPEHYFHQDLWAAKRVFQSREKTHYDIGSSIAGFVAHISVFCSVKVIDIRPQTSKIENVEFVLGDLTNLNLADDSLASLSCLHAAEHVGLGRYGDQIDPLGTQKAVSELQRVLARKGNLYFSVPVGKEKICFNAHRVFSPKTIIEYFNELVLQSCAIIDDSGDLIENPEIDKYVDAQYCCGLFHFTKP